MDQIECINVEQASDMLATGKARLVDIRDAQSYALAHIAGAFHLTNSSLNTFIQETGFDTPLLVICYHGVSSKSAAAYLLTQGFNWVYSVEGGFERWHQVYPEQIESPQR